MEQLFSEFCPIFPGRSASVRSDDSRSHSPPSEIIDQTPDEWGLCPDFMDRREHRPRDIEIYDFRIPFYIFTVLIDLRDRLRWQFSLPDPVSGVGVGRAINKPMSKARAEATVTKVMERMKPSQRFSDHDPYNVKGRQLASYVSTTTGMKVRLPYELCDVMLSTGPEGLLINGTMVKREVVEAILQCRLHDEEGVFIPGIVFETNEVKKEKEMLQGKAYLATLDDKASKELPQKKNMESSAVCNATGPPSNTASTSDSEIPAAGASSPSGEGAANAEEISSPRRPQFPTISYTRSSCGKILEVDTASPTRRRHSARRNSMAMRPFMGYEPKAIAELAENYCGTEYNLPVIIDESIVRLLFGMPERGRTLKVGGESGWGKYGKDVKMKFDYFLE